MSLFRETPVTAIRVELLCRVCREPMAAVLPAELPLNAEDRWAILHRCRNGHSENAIDGVYPRIEHRDGTVGYPRLEER